MLDYADLKFWISFFKGRFQDLNEEGATAVEYGLLVALIAVAIITIVTLLGKNLGFAFKKISDLLPTS